MAYWGFHLALDCKECFLPYIKDADNVKRFAQALVIRIDMKAYGEPQVIHFGEGDKEGFTLVQLIETSNICGHFCNDTGDCYIDVFSCKEYNKEIVIDTVKEFFAPKSIRQTYLTRQA